MPDYIQQVLGLEVRAGEATRVEKMVTFSSSRDPAVGDTLEKAARSAGRYMDFGPAWERHAAAWGGLWRACDLQVDGDERVQLLLRLHTSHLLQVCRRHTADLDAGVPARGLNGEAYRGHVFWDELFVIPYLEARMPDVARGLLMYRCRRLPEARALAGRGPTGGPCIPWQSGSEGTEETQRSTSTRCRAGGTRTTATASATWASPSSTTSGTTCRPPGTTPSWSDHGAEMLLEIARFWSSLAHLDPERDRYEIHGVMGPDEFHERDRRADGTGCATTPTPT